MKKGIAIKVGFWATKCGYEWKDNKSKLLNNKLLKIERELEKVRDYLFENYTDYKKKGLKKRSQKTGKLEEGK